MTDKEVIEIIRAYADIKKKYENLLSALDKILKNERLTNEYIRYTDL